MKISIKTRKARKVVGIVSGKNCEYELVVDHYYSLNNSSVFKILEVDNLKRIVVEFSHGGKSEISLDNPYIWEMVAPATTDQIEQFKRERNENQS